MPFFPSIVDNVFARYQVYNLRTPHAIIAARYGNSFSFENSLPRTTDSRQRVPDKIQMFAVAKVNFSSRRKREVKIAREYILQIRYLTFLQFSCEKMRRLELDNDIF